MERNLLHVISDFQQGSLGAGNLLSALLSRLPEGWDFVHSSVYNFDTLSTGYLVGQYGLQHEDLRPSELIIFADCSPRYERARDGQTQEHENYFHVRLRNGVRIVASNSGYTLSFVRNSIDILRRLKIDTQGAGFRPRDFVPGITGLIAAGAEDWIGKECDPQELVPDYPHGVICYIDNFGNIKTTYRDHDDLIKHVKSQGAGARVRIEINGDVRAAAVGTGPAELLEGDMVFAPQGRGFLDRFWEISCRKGDASASFGNPPPGSPIKLMIHQK